MPTSRGLNNLPENKTVTVIENKEVLKFIPEIPKNPDRRLEVPIKKKKVVIPKKIVSSNKPSVEIVAVVHNNKQLVRKGTKVTSYNPHPNQTDSTPCIAGGTGYNLCDKAKNGERLIALSQELIRWSVYGKNGYFKAGDRIFLDSKDGDSRCNGEFIVADAMNARYKNRADLFFLDRKDNTSCVADIYKVLE